jgi:ribosome biogenesis GTPase
VRPGPPPAVVGVLPRRASLTRKVAGKVTEGQVLAANVDLVFIVAPLPARLRPRGIERYLAMAWESGALPVVLLTKADLVEDPFSTLESVREIAIGVDVHVVSSLSGDGIDAVEALLPTGITAVIVGPSGAGKSTLINHLRGDSAIDTGPVRTDQKGRHTTIHRERHQRPGGGLIIDTPGLRELQLWQSEEGLARTFSDIEDLAAGCRFQDCAHDSEPDCAVAAAIAAGVLTRERLDGYNKLQREQRVLAARQDGRAQAERHRKVKVFSRAVREANALKRPGGTG